MCVKRKIRHFLTPMSKCVQLCWLMNLHYVNKTIYLDQVTTTSRYISY